MMRGTFLTRVARRLLHAESFELVASPALADLQFESPAGIAEVIRSYAGVGAALTGAVCRDAGADVRLMLDDAPTLASLVAMQVSYFGGLLVLISGLTARDAFGALSTTTSLGLLLLIALLSTVSTVLLFWPARRCSSS